MIDMEDQDNQKEHEIDVEYDEIVYKTVGNFPEMTNSVKAQMDVTFPERRVSGVGRNSETTQTEKNSKRILYSNKFPTKDKRDS